jgi:anti-sigma B factor antagonist
MTGQLGNVQLQRKDRVALAVLSGEIDMSNATWIRHEIAAFVTPDDDAVVIDLSELEFIDSAGLHSLVELGNLLSERRQQLFLSAATGSHVERALEIVGMRSAVPVHPSRDEALEAARASAVERRPVEPTDGV